MAAATTGDVGMHADVYILDRNLDRLRAVDHHFRGALETVASSEHAIEEICIDADIVIGAVLVVGARAPRLVSDALVEKMRPGSVRRMDMRRRPRRMFRVNPTDDPLAPLLSRSTGSIFYCVANMPGAVPYTSTHCHSQRHAALHAQHRCPWLAGCGALGDPALAEGVTAWWPGAWCTNPSPLPHGLSFTPLAAVLRHMLSCGSDRTARGPKGRPSHAAGGAGVGGRRRASADVKFPQAGKFASLRCSPFGRSQAREPSWRGGLTASEQCDVGRSG